MGKITSITRTPTQTDTASGGDLWSSVENYFDGLLMAPDPVLEEVQRANADAGLPEIAVTASQGKFLHLLARIQRARRILEIGTLGGYSTIWLARALPVTGRLVTIEVDPKHFTVAQANIARAGVANIVDQRLGPALEMLPKLEARDRTPFDFIFIDADKENNAAYFQWALRLSRAGSMMVIDNVVREGKVADPAADDAQIQGVRRLTEVLAAERRVTATTVQTVGSKGYDGFTLVLVTG